MRPYLDAGSLSLFLVYIREAHPEGGAEGKLLLAAEIAGNTLGRGVAERDAAGLERREELRRRRAAR